MIENKKGILEKWSEKLIIASIFAPTMFTLFHDDDHYPFEVYSSAQVTKEYRILRNFVVIDPSKISSESRKGNSHEIQNEKIPAPSTLSPPSNLQFTIAPK